MKTEQEIPAPELIDDVVVRIFRIPSRDHPASFEAHVDPVRDTQGKVIRTAPTVPELLRAVTEVIEARADRSREEDLRQFRGLFREESNARALAEAKLAAVRERLEAAGLSLEEEPS